MAIADAVLNGIGRFLIGVHPYRHFSGIDGNQSIVRKLIAHFCRCQRQRIFRQPGAGQLRRIQTGLRFQIRGLKPADNNAVSGDRYCGGVRRLVKHFQILLLCRGGEHHINGDIVYLPRALGGIGQGHDEPKHQRCYHRKNHDKFVVIEKAGNFELAFPAVSGRFLSQKPSHSFFPRFLTLKNPDFLSPLLSGRVIVSRALISVSLV